MVLARGMTAGSTSGSLAHLRTLGEGRRRSGRDPGRTLHGATPPVRSMRPGLGPGEDVGEYGVEQDLPPPRLALRSRPLVRPVHLQEERVGRLEGLGPERALLFLGEGGPIG